MRGNKKSTTQRVKIDDVAKLAGVSTATVSRVINSTGIVSARTTEKVHRAITDLKFVAHGSARGLAGSKTNTIGLILPGITTFFFTELIQGISKCIYDLDYSLLMYADQQPVSMASGNPLPLGEHNTDGIIVFTDFLDDYSIQYFYEQSLPIVMLHRSPPAGLPIPRVVFENETGAYDVVNHLISQGNKRIAYLRGPQGNEDSQQREVGYRRALNDASIEIDERLIGCGEFAVDDGRAAVQKLLDENLQFDAIFAGDDNSAIGAVEALNGYGLQVPNDIAVVGFNDDYMSQYIQPALTTVRAPIYQSGFEAAQKLLDMIEEKEVGMESSLPVELVIRDSSMRRLNG